MRVGLSSAAAPGATLDELLGACALRGLPALELREGDAHGVHPGMGVAAASVARDAAAAAGIVITGYRTFAEVGDAAGLAAFGRALASPLILALPGPTTTRLAAAVRLLAAGADVLIATRSGLTDGEVASAISHGLGLAWDADPDLEHLGARTATLLDAAGPALRTILMIGGGPEAAMHEGQGVGELMARLALARYDGAFVLAPSTPRYQVAWDSWLGRRGGWGCGSRAADPSLVQLDNLTVQGGIR